MSEVSLKSVPAAAESEEAEPPGQLDSRPGRRRVIPVLVTFGAVAMAAVLVWATWNAYMTPPWTRDGTVRVYVVTTAPEVAGRIVALPIVDNQFVHKGDLLMVVDPTNYKIAVEQAEAAAAQAKAVARNAEAQAQRRRMQTNLSVSDEQKEIFESQAESAEAAYRLSLANLDQARTNLKRTRIVSPVDGYITNLQTRLGDYVNVGERSISIVEANSFWVDGYFEETSLGEISKGDPVTVKLMGYSQIVRGHVDSVARGINVANAQSAGSGLASVNPIFTWVRLAQRVPVRIHIDVVPADVRLVAGMTATVRIEHHPDKSAD